jgi:hypothetical protein
MSELKPRGDLLILVCMKSAVPTGRFEFKEIGLFGRH